MMSRESDGEITAEDQLVGEEKLKLEKLKEEISTLKLEGYKVDELKTHIDKLHEYNEIKDATQLVLGRLAVLDGVTVKQMHENYGLTDEST